MAARTSVLVAALALAAAGCQRTPARPAHHEPAARVELLPSGSHATVPLTHDLDIDGEWTEPAWNATALSGMFVGDDGTSARPVSQVRLLAEPDFLVVGLYAADDDIRTTDHFEITAGPVALQIDPHGTVSPLVPGARAAVDTDGTIDDASDDDEEWVVEVAIPRAALGDPAVPLPVRTARCDVTKDGVAHCGSWRGVVQLP